MESPEKFCPSCKEPLPRSAFGKCRSTKDGLATYCKACRNAKRKQWRQDNPEAARATAKRCRERSRDKTREAARRWRHANRERYNASGRARRLVKKDEINQRARSKRAQNPEAYRKYERKYYNTPKGRETARVKVERRRALRAQAPGNYTVQDVKEQLSRQKGYCYWCGKTLNKKYEIDHVIPLDKGGSNGPENLVIACQHCNRSKCNKLPHEWEGNGGKLL